MKFILIFIITCVTIKAHAQIDSTNIKSFDTYYPETKQRVIGKTINGILVDTILLFNKKNELIIMQVFQGNNYPREVYFIENLKGSYAKKRDGYYTQINGSEFIKNKVWKYYYKNGRVMDSIIYQNGKQVYQAKLDKNGKIKFEQK